MPPPQKLRKTDEGMEKGTPDGVIRFEVDKISTMQQIYDGDDRYSPEVIVKGVPWRGNVYRRNDNLTASLYCMNNQSTPWSIDVDVEVILINVDKNKNITIGHSFTCTNEDDDYYKGFYVLKWKKLIDIKKGFVKDDKITIEFHFWISNMNGIKYFPRIDFTDSNYPCHDVALVIEGEKIYASKQILAAHSLFFKSLFFGAFAENDKKEIELKDVNRQEFLEMLEVIYPSCKKIIDSSAEFLVKLGDRFQIAGLIDRAEKVLIDAVFISDMDKLIIADKYRLFGLLKHCLSKLKTTKNFKDLEASPVYNDLSDATKAILFSRVLKVAK